MTAALSGCVDDARPAATLAPTTVKIGMFSAKATAAVEMAGLFTSEPLVAAAWDGRPSFKLAEDVAESRDGRQLTVTLRRGVRFHTGEAVTAQIVRTLLAKKLTRAPEIAAIEALDEQRLRLTLHRPFSVKPEDLSTLIVDNGDGSGLGLRTGPFKISTTDPVVLESFAGHHQGAPAVQRIEISQYPTQRAAWTGMMRREVNVLHEVSRDSIDFIEAGGDIRAYPLLRPYYTALTFSMRHPHLRRREVRLAINEGVNRGELVDNAMRGHGRVAEGPFWPYHWAYPEGRFPPTFNPQAAKLRLDAAGLKVAAGNGQMPARFSFTCLVLSGDDRFERISLLVQRQLYAIGIDMKIVPVPFDELRHRLETGDFDAFLLETVSGRILSWAYRFWHSPAKGAPSHARTGYVAADAALEQLQVARTDDDVRRAVADVMHAMRSDPPAAFLVWPREARAADAEFDIPYEADRDIFGTFWQMRRPAALNARGQ